MLESNLQELTADVVGGLLGGKAAVATCGDTAGPGELCAGVTMSGAWNGTLLVRSSPGAVLRAAEIMLSVALERPTAEDLRDFLEEIANVMARTLKTVLPGVETSLPFPVVDVSAVTTLGSVVKLDLSGAPMLVGLVAAGADAAQAKDGVTS